MTPEQTAVVRDLVARLKLAQERITSLENEVAYLRAREPDKRLIASLKNRAYHQKQRAEMWKARALRKAAA